MDTSLRLETSTNEAFSPRKTTSYNSRDPLEDEDQSSPEYKNFKSKGKAGVFFHHSDNKKDPLTSLFVNRQSYQRTLEDGQNGYMERFTSKIVDNLQNNKHREMMAHIRVKPNKSIKLKS